MVGHNIRFKKIWAFVEFELFQDCFCPSSLVMDGRSKEGYYVTLSSLIVVGSKVHLNLVIWVSGNTLKWVDICETSLHWGVSNILEGVIVMPLITKIEQTMYKLGRSLSL